MKNGEKYTRGNVHRYLEDLSGRSITPGGGSAAALAAAIGAGLNLMVINYSIKEGSSGGNELVFVKTKQREIMDVLIKLVDDDCKVFRELMEAKEEDKQEKYINAASVPMEVCRQSCQSMEITALLLEDSNRNLITDVGCAAQMLKAAFSSASLNVMVNLAFIKDEELVNNSREELAEMEKAITNAASEITSQVHKMIKEQNGQ